MFETRKHWIFAVGPILLATLAINVLRVLGTTPAVAPWTALFAKLFGHAPLDIIWSIIYGVIIAWAALYVISWMRSRIACDGINFSWRSAFDETRVPLD